MKLLRVETRAKSVYIIDPVAKTWERQFKSEDSGEIRTENGQYHALRLELTERMELECPPLTEGALYRLISTSEVVSINEFESQGISKN